MAGLARDGGLYMPESWPRLTPAQIAGLAGQPFHEVAVQVIAPFGSDGKALAAARFLEQALRR